MNTETLTKPKTHQGKLEKSKVREVLGSGSEKWNHKGGSKNGGRRKGFAS